MSNSATTAETITPADLAAVSAAVRDAADKGLAIYPCGGGTRLNARINHRRPGVRLSLANLNRTIDYPVADMTITVEAGLTIAELHRQLAANRQRLPIDIAQPERATVGGAVAVNAAGPRRYAYGTMRDYVLGLTAVNGHGTIFHAGGRVVKNAAGYNICRLLTGSFGTLGVLTQVTLMVRPQCESSVFLVCDVPSFENAEKILADLVSSPARPAAVDFVAGRHYENDLILGPVLEGHVGRLYVGLEGPAPDVDWMVEQLRSRWMAIGATEPMLIPTSRAESLWRWLTEFTPDVQINVLPSTAVETIVQALAIDPDCTVRAHAGDGILRIKLAERKDDAAQAAVVEQLSKLANTFGGKITSQYPTAVETAKRSNPELRILQAIKERFDPQNILNPGRYLFD